MYVVPSSYHSGTWAVVDDRGFYLQDRLCFEEANALVRPRSPRMHSGHPGDARAATYVPSHKAVPKPAPYSYPWPRR